LVRDKRWLGVIAGILFTLVLALGAWAQQAPENTPEHPEQMYVSDKLQVTVRTGPSTQNKVIAVVRTGQKVSVLERTPEGWARVRLADGREGWMIARYLMKDKPAMLKLAELDPRTKNLAKRLEELGAANAQLKRQLADATRRLNALRAQYNKLLKTASSAQELANAKAELEKKLAVMTKELKQLQQENEALKFASTLKWFLAGAGVLVVGWLIGLMSARRKRRYSSYM